ncbi:hypothetical protein [Geodermatophilus pulveris]|nr:hypothetical protein [Geodermatophilus pulveris]
MGEATVSAAVAASDPSWADVVSAVGAAVAAVAAVATVMIAVVAARYARGQVQGVRDQLEEARTLRREQAQPYVVIYAVPNPVDPQASDIVVKNFGTTGASDVTVSSSPPLMRADWEGDAEEVALPTAMPFLAPGQEWRTFWDLATQRELLGLPDRYNLTVTYTDSLGTTHTTRAVLDWDVFRQRVWITEKTLHNAATSLDSIDRTLKAATRSDRVQQVAVYDGAERDRQRADARRQREELVPQLRHEPAASTGTEDGQP